MKEELTSEGRKASDWKEMWRWMQEFHRFSRRMTAQRKKQALTQTEMELLASLSMEGEITPLLLSHKTGMKMESVSRTLKALYEKNCIVREKSARDARSIRIRLSEEGRRKLEADCRLFLWPVYELKQEMREDFLALAGLIQQADLILEQAGKENL